MSVSSNLEALSKSIPPSCALIAVSKTQSPEKILEAYHWGQRAFGENRAQELASKFETLPKDIQWHMIGHLQTNKVKYIVPFVHLIHSIDSARLLEEVNRQGAKVRRVISCLLQVHIAEEESKFGFSPEEVSEYIRDTHWPGLPFVQVIGLMGMATFTDDTRQVRREFSVLKNLFDKLRGGELTPAVRMEQLSMGMSGDYTIAIEEGSTMIRVGTAIFGNRAN